MVAKRGQLVMAKRRRVKLGLSKCRGGHVLFFSPLVPLLVVCGMLMMPRLTPGKQDVLT